MGVPGWRFALDGLLQAGYSPCPACYRLSGYFPVFMGVERPVGFLGLPGRHDACDDLPNQQYGHIAGRWLAFAHRGGVPFANPADDRVLLAAALLRAWHALWCS